MKLLGSKYLIILMILLFLTKFSFAGLEVEVSRSENGRITWKDMETGKYRHEFDMKIRDDYMRKQPGYGNLKGTTSAISNLPVKGTITQTIPKKSVMKGLLGNAIKGGKALASATPMGVARALVFELAFNLVVEKLKENGFEWSEQENNFVDTKSDYILQFKTYEYEPKEGWVVRRQFGMLHETYKVGYEYGWRPLFDAACKSDKSSYAYKKWVEESGYHVKGADEKSISCVVELNGDIRSYGSVNIVKNQNRVITQTEFDEIMIPIADSNPAPYVEASANEKGNLPNLSEPEVYLLPGQVAQSAPYTNPITGKPEQARWKVVDDPSAPGKSSKIEEEIIPRPDLTPNSPPSPHS